jgi:hypothetical protein
MSYLEIGASVGEKSRSNCKRTDGDIHAGLLDLWIARPHDSGQRKNEQHE